jgi:uncharacterized integral membrane protein
MKPKTVISLVLVALVAVLVLQNSMLVPFRMLLWPVYMPVFLLVLGVFAIGLVVGYLAGRTGRRREGKPIPSGTPPASPAPK